MIRSVFAALLIFVIISSSAVAQSLSTESTPAGELNGDQGDIGSLYDLLNDTEGSAPTDPLDGLDTAETADAGEWESLGLVSDSEWQSPQHGTTISWDTGLLMFPRKFENAILQDPAQEYDALTLLATDESGMIHLSVESSGSAITPQLLAEYWITPEYGQLFGRDQAILDWTYTATTASIIYSANDDLGIPYIGVTSGLFLDDGSVVVTHIAAWSQTQDIGHQYQLLQDGVMVNGASIILPWTVDQVRAYHES